jgi:hypothetical protein
MIQGAVGIVDSEVDAELAGADLLYDRLDVAAQRTGQSVPFAKRSARVSADTPWVELCDASRSVRSARPETQHGCPRARRRLALTNHDLRAVRISVQSLRALFRATML